VHDYDLCPYVCIGFFRGRKDKRREHSRDRKERSTSRKRSRKDEEKMKSKAKPMKVIKLLIKTPCFKRPPSADTKICCSFSPAQAAK